MSEEEPTEQELQQLIQLEKELSNPQTVTGNDIVSSAYHGIQQDNNNLIVWQLELDNILERIEHLLKGDIIIEKADGSLDYQKPEDTRLIVLNDYGVQLIMNIISFYLNRNTILSNYEVDRVREILYDLGNELADLIYINYEAMGLDTVEKKSRSAVLVMNILHLTESAYNRALAGEERDSLRSARVVTQTQPLGYGGGSNLPPPTRKFSLNPLKRMGF